MHDASLQFGVPIVGGHLHPDTPYSVIDVAILGIAPRDAVIYSHTARDGDAIMIAIDLDGRVHPSCALNWDSVTMKSADEVRAQVRLMQELGGAHLVTAGKDISNPGMIGTLGMLLEMSGKGAVVELERLPRPDLAANYMTFEQWIRIYPGMGFVFTVPEENTGEIRSRFAGVGMSAAVVGSVDSSRKLQIVYAGEGSSVFDFYKNGIMRLFSDDGS
jgi:hypothetical protein